MITGHEGNADHQEESMIRFTFIRQLIATVIVVSVVCGTAWAGRDEAWQALHNLEITRAKELFQQELRKSPKDLSLMRGLLVAAYFDLDYETQIQMVKTMVKADPQSPYLIPVFEHVVAKMTGWSDQLGLQRQIGEALAKHATGALAHTGKHIIGSYHEAATCTPPTGWLVDMGYAPGCWVAGPFENLSQIAAYRPVPFEAEPLDTLATVTGKNGSKAGWTWLPVNKFGDFLPNFVVENAADLAFQFRIFFELPSDMTILVLPGGAYNSRVLIDGKKVYDDPTLRNATQREGFRVQLNQGAHQLTFVLGTENVGIGFSIGILDANYQPIAGIRWPRYAHFSANEAVTAENIHPIFDPFDAYVSDMGEEPDTRYWKAVLQTYNGYTAEAVRELEKLFNENDLSLLEIWTLYQSLQFNGEFSLALEYLKHIKERVSTAATDAAWIWNTVKDYEAQIKAFQELDRKYPDRLDCEFMSVLKSMLNRDMKTLMSDLTALKAKYPEAASVSAFMAKMYRDFINDPESAFREFTESCRISKNKRQQIVESSDYFVSMRKYDKAIDHARKAVATFPQQEGAIRQLFNAYSLAHKEDQLVPTLRSLKREFPYNIELHSMLYQIHSKAGRFDDAKQILQEIHDLKPSAALPYMSLDSLHNYATYDSIFGSIDVMALWDVQPSETELVGNNYWYLLDRQQRVVFESGMTLSDMHWATVLLGQEIVEQFQETYLGFDPEQRFNKLLVARRLRKGQPPLSGTVDGAYVVFKDLQPGDAVELHYRIWESREGDLWKEFWENYKMFADSYQRYWEYTILTNRGDLKYVSVPPAPDPVIGEHCGFKKISWRGEKTPALDLNLAMLPPLDDLAGKVFVSTTSDWETLNYWYTSISEAVLAENPRTDELADRLVAGKTSDAEKLRALYRHVVLDIPYQLITFDYHSSIPHKPDDALLNRWGDCKDKGHLLIQMLRHAGIEAWPVLVMSRDYGTRMPLPQFDFDHLITQCVIDGDTLFVDATEVTFPPERSLSGSIAGQPYMPVGAKQGDQLRRLPLPQTDDSHWKADMKISPKDKDVFDFVYENKYYNLEAGYRRHELRGYSQAELKKELESAYSEDWGVILSIDSVAHDSIRSIDSVFSESWYGTINLSVQTIGQTTIVNLPRWSTIPRGLLSFLEGDQKREFAVDLRTYVGRHEKTVELSVPHQYGFPELLDRVEVKDSLLNFVFRSEWDQDSRMLSLHYLLEVEDGHTKPDVFLAFSKKVIETFDSPLLFQRH